MVIRKELLDWKQEQIRYNNQAEFERHKKQASQIKERDLQAVLNRIQHRQEEAKARVASQEKAYSEQWKLYHAEEDIKKAKRDKKKQREQRKLFLKKEAVIEKMLKNAEQVAQRKA